MEIEILFDDLKVLQSLGHGYLYPGLSCLVSNDEVVTLFSLHIDYLEESFSVHVLCT